MTEENSQNLNALRLKHKIPMVDANEPWRDDKLQRKNLADAIVRMISGQDQPVVLAITGAWGSGKTFFLQRLQAELKLRQWEVIYYSAWEDDHVSDPLISICGQMLEHFRGSKNFTEATNLIGRAAKRIATNGIGAATLGVLSIDENTLRTPYGNVVNQYHDQLLARTALKQRIEALAERVREETDGPLLFMIDELDRCRPNYAIETLERIKHLLSVPNVVFVLGLDLHQLEKSIRAVYGEIDSREYLKRFIDLDIHLPTPDHKSYIMKLVQEQQLLSRIEECRRTAGHRLIEQTENFAESFSEIASLLQLELRQIEHVLRRFVLTLYFTEDRTWLCPDLLALLIALREKNRVQYQSLQNDNGGEVLQYLYDKLKEPLKDQACPYWFLRLEALIYSLNRTYGDNGIVPLAELLQFDGGGERPRSVAQFRQKKNREDLQQCIALLQNTFHHTSANTLKTLKSRIEAAEKYVTF